MPNSSQSHFLHLLLNLLLIFFFQKFFIPPPVPQCEAKDVPNTSRGESSVSLSCPVWLSTFLLHRVGQALHMCSEDLELGGLAQTAVLKNFPPLHLVYGM